MTPESLLHFRTFIMDSFTAVAVSIFNEVQTMVQTHEDENKRLRALLDSVVQPRVLLRRIDDGARVPEPGLSSATASTATSPPVELQKLKQEEMEFVIIDNMDPVKTEPELMLISHSHGVVEMSDTSLTSTHASAPPSEPGDQEEAEEEREEEEDSSGEEPPLQRTLLECPRFKKPDSTFLPTPSEYKGFICRLTEAYKDLPEEQRPLITTMGLQQDVEFVECALGLVPKGCPLSYQHPLPSDQDFTPLDRAPPQPRLPLQSETMPLSETPPLFTETERKIINSLALTWENAHTLEQATRDYHKELSRDSQNGRLFNCFQEVMSLKNAQGKTEQLVARLKRGKRKCKQDMIEREQRTEAVREYCRLTGVNFYPCGVVVHPAAPWMAVRPDGVVYDPSEEVSFGILHVRCESQRGFMKSAYVQVTERGVQVDRTRPEYFQIQGQMMVSGTSWCDLLLFCEDQVWVQRLYRDQTKIQTIKHKMDLFYFQHFLPSLSSGPDQDTTRTRPGPDKGQPRTRPGPDRGQPRSRPGADQVQTRSRPGLSQDQTRPGLS